jgi:hypothetical protein
LMTTARCAACWWILLRFKESLQHLFFKLWIVTLQALQRASSTEGLCAVGR